VPFALFVVEPPFVADGEQTTKGTKNTKQQRPLVLCRSGGTIIPMASPGTEPSLPSDPLQLDHCPGCGYPLQALHREGLCPECGLPYRRYEIVLYGRPSGSAGSARWVREFVVPTALAGVVAAVLAAAGQPCLALPVGAGFWLAMFWLTRARLAAGPPVRALLGPQGYAECLAGGQSVVGPWSPRLRVSLARIDRKHCRLTIVSAAKLAAAATAESIGLPMGIEYEVDLAVVCDPGRAEQVCERIRDWCPSAVRAAETEVDEQTCSAMEFAKSSRGVLLSLSEQQVRKLKSFEDENDRLGYLQERLEDGYFSERPKCTAEMEYAWDAIHRCLTDGRLGVGNGRFPFTHVILGGEQLHGGGHYVLALKTPEQVAEIARMLGTLAREFIFERYDRIDPADYNRSLSSKDRQGTWEWFQDVVAFYRRAARDGRYVLFTFHP
jgi:hypothetical protein